MRGARTELDRLSGANNTHASGGPLEQEGLSPTVRLYSRISTVSNWSCFLLEPFLRLGLLPCKLSSCVKTLSALFLGTFVVGTEDTLFRLIRCVASMTKSVPRETVVLVSSRSFHIAQGPFSNNLFEGFFSNNSVCSESASFFSFVGKNFYSFSLAPELDCCIHWIH